MALPEIYLLKKIMQSIKNFYIRTLDNDNEAMIFLLGFYK